MKKIIVIFFAMQVVFFNSYSQTTTTIRLSSSTGQDAYVTDFWSNTNLGSDPDIAAIAWSSSGTPYVGRSYFKFNLTNIPANAVVSDAKLSLYGNPDPLHSPGHSTLSGSNTAFLQRVIGDWDESTITWDTKPSGTTSGDIDLAQSTSQTQNYLNIDVTSMVSQMVASPSTNYGFLLSLNVESAYRSLNFASGDCADTNARPKLVVTYTVPNAIAESENDNIFKIYPNPAMDKLTVETQNAKGVYELHDISGKLMFSGNIISERFDMDVKNISAGTYILTIQNEKGKATKKVEITK